MRRFIVAAVLTAALMGAASAQRATEQYIPIGQSPGARTMQGELTATVEPAAAGGAPVIAMRPAGADTSEVSYVVGPETRIYVDRSAQGLPNLLGGMDDLQAGRVVEVCVPDPQSRVALWIKVRPES